MWERQLLIVPNYSDSWLLINSDSLLVQTIVCDRVFFFFMANFQAITTSMTALLINIFPGFFLCHYSVRL